MTDHRVVKLDGSPLSIEDVAAIADRAARIELAASARAAMEDARRTVEAIAAGDAAVYGLNTGFGSLSRVRIEADQLEHLQTNIVRSHAAGVGAPLPPRIVRAMMAILAGSLARGLSGVRPDLVDRLAFMLERDIVPVVPSRGSVGASGDLSPLAHIALTLLGEGHVHWNGRIEPTGLALSSLRMPVLRLAAKEGLALLNGTHLMAGCGALVLHDLDRILDAATIATAMSLDACLASHGPLDAAIHEARRQPGQIAIAAKLRALLHGSKIVESHRIDDPRVQDPYSLRAAPQVLGAAVDAIDAARVVFERELGAVTDNPLVLPDGDGGRSIRSGGNFHGMPLAIHLDLIRIAAAHVAGISERRVFWVLSGHDAHNPVTPYLAADPGLQSGLMIAQYTAAACASELQTIANPASVANIPTSAGIEDYNSMGATAGLLALRSVELLRSVVAIELLVMAQALEHQRPLTSGPGVEAAHAALRRVVSPLSGDRAPARDIAAVERLVASGGLG